MTIPSREKLNETGEGIGTCIYSSSAGVPFVLIAGTESDLKTLMIHLCDMDESRIDRAAFRDMKITLPGKTHEHN